MSDNPYAPPEAQATAPDSPAELTRRQHINTEATIRSLGSLYVAGGVFMIIGGTRVLSNFQARDTTAETVGYLLGAIGVPIILIVLGLKMRKLRKVAVIIGGLFHLGTLFLVPIGTLIGSLILFSIFNKKGRYVVTQEYKEIVVQTPHIKYRTSIITWLLLAIFLLLLIGVAVMAANR